jgi:hypothetical protein
VRSPADTTVSRSTCLPPMVGIKLTARRMPGCAEAYSQTTSACSTGWGIPMNGVRTIRMPPRDPEQRE